MILGSQPRIVASTLTCLFSCCSKLRTIPWGLALPIYESRLMTLTVPSFAGCRTTSTFLSFDRDYDPVANCAACAVDKVKSEAYFSMLIINDKVTESLAYWQCWDTRLEQSSIVAVHCSTPPHSNKSVPNPFQLDDVVQRQFSGSHGASIFTFSWFQGLNISLLIEQITDAQRPLQDFDT